MYSHPYIARDGYWTRAVQHAEILLPQPDAVEYLDDKIQEPRVLVSMRLIFCFQSIAKLTSCTSTLSLL